jgi:hypothetical protein
MAVYDDNCTYKLNGIFWRAVGEYAQLDDAGERLQGHQSIHCPHPRTVIPLSARLSLSRHQ